MSTLAASMVMEARASSSAPPVRRRGGLGTLVKVVVTVALLGLLFWQIARREGVDALLAELTSLDVRWLLVATALHFVAVFSGVARWGTLLSAFELPLPLALRLRAFLVGRFYGAFTPSTTGLDGYRIIEANRVTGELARSTATIVVEKLVGLVSMATVCVVLVPFGLYERLGPAAILVALGMASVALVGLVVVARPRLVEALARRLPRAVAKRLERVVEALSHGHLDLRAIASSIALGIVAHAALSATFAAAGLALGVALPVTTLLAVGNAIVIAVLLPISVGGVGVREGVAFSLLVSASVSTSEATLVATLGYLTGQVPALVGGLLSLLPAPTPRAS